jgi:hypothetical protein
MIRTFVIAAALAASPAAAATYLPVGPQLNVAVGTVTGGGWSLCYSATMATIFGSSASVALSDCAGDRLLVAGRETGSGTLLVLAQALKTDVLFNTGAENNGTTNIANGTGWYNADNWSFGFVPAGDTPNKNECDTASGIGRLCIHTLTFTGGYRINHIQGLNSRPVGRCGSPASAWSAPWPVAAGLPLPPDRGQPQFAKAPPGHPGGAFSVLARSGPTCPYSAPSWPQWHAIERVNKGNDRGHRLQDARSV